MKGNSQRWERSGMRSIWLEILVLAKADSTEAALPLLKRMLDAAGFNSTVVFLGDNIYPSGLPEPESRARLKSEVILDEQLDTVSGHDGQVIFIPGNHDWGGRGLGGSRETLRRQEIYVEQALDRGNTFLPDNGFAGPVEVALNDEITLIVLDTQWWLEPDKPVGDTGSYELDQIGRVLIEMEDILIRNEGKRVVVVGHHPVLSDGEHGGYYDTMLSPVSLIRRYLGTPQDFSNLGYRRLRKALFGVFETHPGLIYGSGHDHSLQYVKQKEQHYIVSGSGSKNGVCVKEWVSTVYCLQAGFCPVDVLHRRFGLAGVLGTIRSLQARRTLIQCSTGRSDTPLDAVYTHNE